MKTDVDPHLLHEYRVGLLGSSATGKTSLAARFANGVLDRLTNYEDDLSQLPEKTFTSSRDIEEVYSVIVRRGPLGITIGQHPNLKHFACVQSFVTSPNNKLGELQLSGSVEVGDVLISANRQNLVKHPPAEVAEILRNLVGGFTPLVITFLRPRAAAKDDKENEVSRSHDDSGHSSVPSLAYADVPTVNIVTTYTMLPHQANLIELVDTPGIDSKDAILCEWLPHLDGLVLVYAADSVTSLLELERRYAKIITQTLNKEMHNIPIVVLCTKSNAASACRNVLITEGKALAEAWSALFFETDNDINNLDTIFQQLLAQIDVRNPATADTSTTWTWIPTCIALDGPKKPLRKLAYPPTLLGAEEVDISTSVSERNGLYMYERRRGATHDIVRYKTNKMDASGTSRSADRME